MINQYVNWLETAVAVGLVLLKFLYPAEKTVYSFTEKEASILGQNMYLNLIFCMYTEWLGLLSNQVNLLISFHTTIH